MTLNINFNHPVLPNKQGQICENVKRPEDVYIITEDLEIEPTKEFVEVVALNDLQRNSKNPQLAPRQTIPKINLSVLAENLTSYIESWNKI